MSLNLFLAVSGIMLCIAGSAWDERTADVIIQHRMKQDTTHKMMTPLNIRETDDKKKLEIVFQESPRFFYLNISDGNRKTKMNTWKKMIADKTKLMIGFIENTDGNAIIVSFKP